MFNPGLRKEVLCIALQGQAACEPQVLSFQFSFLEKCSFTSADRCSTRWEEQRSSEWLFHIHPRSLLVLAQLHVLLYMNPLRTWTSAFTFLWSDLASSFQSRSLSVPESVGRGWLSGTCAGLELCSFLCHRSVVLCKVTCLEKNTWDRVLHSFKHGNAWRLSKGYCCYHFTSSGHLKYLSPHPLLSLSKKKKKVEMTIIRSQTKQHILQTSSDCSCFTLWSLALDRYTPGPFWIRTQWSCAKSLLGHSVCSLTRLQYLFQFCLSVTTS